MQYEKTHIRVDDATIAAGDPSAIMQPVSYIANIYDGPAEYEQSMRPFSQGQRQFFALMHQLRDTDELRAELAAGVVFAEILFAEAALFQQRHGQRVAVGQHHGGGSGGRTGGRCFGHFG